VLRRSQPYWSENSVSVRSKATILLRKSKAKDYFIFHFYFLPGVKNKSNDFTEEENVEDYILFENFYYSE